MAIAYLDPAGDSGPNEWDLLPDDHGAHAHYLHLNDGVRDPAAGDGEMLQTELDNQSELFMFPNMPSAESVSQVRIKCYCNHTMGVEAPTIHADLFIAGGWLGAVDLITAAAPAWKTATFGAAWTEAQVNGCVAKLRSDRPAGGQVHADALYLEVTYVPTAADGAAGMLGCNF